MGRPPLNMTPTLVRFPSDVLDRIDAVAGKKQRASFIRDAVVSELNRREKAPQPVEQDGCDEPTD